MQGKAALAVGQKVYRTAEKHHRILPPCESSRIARKRQNLFFLAAFRAVLRAGIHPGAAAPGLKEQSPDFTRIALDNPWFFREIAFHQFPPVHTRPDTDRIEGHRNIRRSCGAGRKAHGAIPCLRDVRET